MNALSSSGARVLLSLVQGDSAAASALFAGPIDIDDPFAGRCIGAKALSLVGEWSPRRYGELGDIAIDHVSADGVWEFTETRVPLTRWGGREVEVCVAVMTEQAGPGLLRRARLYYRRQLIDGGHHLRAPLLDDDVHPDFPPILREYQAALRVRDFDRFLATFADDAYVDFHGEQYAPAPGIGLSRYEGRAAIAYAFGGVFSITPTNPRILRHQNAFRSGDTWVLEFFLARADEALGHAGAAAYIVQDGRVASARIYDEAWG